MLASCAWSPRGERAEGPPAAPKEPVVRDIHGERFVDEFAWLKNRDDPRTIAYLQAENAYTESVMSPTRTLQKRLYNEILSRVQEDDTTAPYRKHGYWYYSRTEKGKPYAVYCRKQGTLDAAEEVILDGNAMGAKEEYFALGVVEVSDDGRMLAYSIDTNGSERYTLRFKDLGTGRVLRESIEGTYYTGAWSADGKAFFYVTTDDAMRPYRLWRHAVGGEQAGDALLHEEKDERFNLSVTRSRCGRFVLMNLESQAANEWWSLRADDPTGTLRLIAERRPNVEYSVEAGPDRFYIVTNEGAVNFRLVESSFETAGEAAWRTVIPGRDDVTIEGVDCFARQLVVYERDRGQQRICIRGYKGEPEQRLSFPDAAYTIDAGDNEEFDSHVLRFEYESPITPATIFDQDMETGERTLVKRQPVPNFDPADYEVERRFAPAPDGRQVPITILHRKGFARDGSAAGLQYGYGSYGFSMDPGFSSQVLPLVDRGMVYAIAHVRGGSDMGREWYEDGRLRRKKNTFTDFIACAEFLIREKYVAPDRLAIRGGSAGGLLMGAVVNMRPDLFRVVIADVPFVDVINTMLDPLIPLTVTEYEQWGNPTDPGDYAYMRSYSPYDNVEAKAYPHMLVLAGLNDPRVGYWEPAKWVARLRSMKTDANVLLLKTNMEAGHGGASGRYDAIKEEAFIEAFILERLGVR
ncbi:MAG: S9 family peptidase [Phycisphaerae bacterium]|nr:S9 family peptidase [Phycisphaerae bacterium]